MTAPSRYGKIGATSVPDAASFNLIDGSSGLMINGTQNEKGMGAL